MHWFYRVATASCVLIAAAQPVAGQTVIPIVKQRYTQTLVITPCELKTLFYNEYLECGPFDDVMINVQDCKEDYGFTTSTQHSDVCGPSFSGMGTADAQAVSSGPHHNHAMAVSVYFFKFEVTEPITFTVDGEIRAAGGTLLQENRAELKLVVGNLPLGDPVFEYELDPSPSGEPLIQRISVAGRLEPGEYTFYAEAIASGLAFAGMPLDDEASFEFTFDITGLCPADLNGDDDVGPPDLAILLGAWGPNANHPADLNADGVVGAADIAILLGAWGPCP